MRRSDFGFVFQFGSLVPELSALENVALPMRLSGQRRRAAEATAYDWLDRFDVAVTSRENGPGRCPAGRHNGWPSPARW